MVKLRDVQNMFWGKIEKYIEWLFCAYVKCSGIVVFHARHAPVNVDSGCGESMFMIRETTWVLGVNTH